MRDLLPALPGTEPMPAAAARTLEHLAHRVEATLGPASSVRAIADVAAVPLLTLLGYSVESRVDRAETGRLHLTTARGVRLLSAVLPWAASLDHAWREAVTGAIAADARWCVCCNGTMLRVVDAQRTWSRDYLEFDLAAVADAADAQFVLWSLLRADAMTEVPPLLDRAVELSARHGADVCRSLAGGVLESLGLLIGALAARRRREAPAVLFDHSLTVLYRVLFLLFAEARGLVPMWHPVYRDRYSIDAVVTALLAGRRYRGLWQTIQAISRLAHAGCSAGELKVTAFNGRLFSPAHAAAFDRAPVDDQVMGQTVVAVSTTPAGKAGRARIVYRDLDVEQLGAVYETVLEYEPQARAGAAGGSPLTRTRDVRKASGTFYTPRAVTAALVRRTLAPLVQDRAADEILALRVVDPAMGSGAFLVGACRYLAAAAEDALVREGRWHAHDITAADRVALRRQVASRCLFGVDLNPTAVQLARLSLWLATLASDKPLSFLDHHLTAGNSLVGAAPADLQRQIAPGAGRARERSLPLFEAAGLPAVLERAVRARLDLARVPDDTAAIVRDKEHRLAALDAADGPVGRWRQALDLWCAQWFWEQGPPPDRAVARELIEHVLRGRSTLPRHAAEELTRHAATLARRHRFHHWELAFPEVFTDANGAPLPEAGFDAVIGNPPWDMVRGDSGEGGARDDRRVEARRMTGFVHESGLYRVEQRAHVNRYQLFVERALHLVKPGGRIGFVLPSGMASDVGAAALRRHLFDRADVDEITGLDNREGIFPIHRSVRFVLLTCTAGRPTTSIRCRFGLTQPDALERDEAATAPVVITRRVLSRLSGEDDLGVPEIAGGRDLRLLERVASTIPRLGAADGWNAAFGRELNASDDRGAFTPYTGAMHARPVVEGKQIDPFRVAVRRSRLEVRTDAAGALRVPRRPRVAYRDVASATNRLTLIAAIVPARAVTTHTLFCLRTPLPADAQEVLCGLLNSFVANYLVRLRVNTHVTVSLVSRMPLPFLTPAHPAWPRVGALVRALRRGREPAESMPEYAELQALVARLYGLTADEFEHVLGTFPLIPMEVRQAALRAVT